MSQYKKQKALALLNSGKLEQAKVIYKKLISKNARDGDSWLRLASICTQLGDFKGAEGACLHLIKIAPDVPEPYMQLCFSLIQQSRLEDSIVYLHEALKRHPKDFSMVFEIGRKMHQHYLYDEALACYERVVTLKPDIAQVYLAMASIHKQRCDITKAIQLSRQAINIKKDYHTAHCDLVCAFNYTDDYSPEYIYQEHLKWGEQQSISNRISFNHTNNLELNRRLRIGYVSSDLYQHSVAYFFEPLLKNHDTNDFNTFCYADERVSDDVTKRLKSHSCNWRSTQKLNDIQLAQLINNDKIDILVDLSGHTANSRLLSFTTKPAPVQVTYLGYPNTTGVLEIDYRLTDNYSDPEGVTDSWCSEKLIRLENSFLCYQPLNIPLDISQLPLLECGVVTFGSFNNMAKITSEVVQLWSRILSSIPDSRLIIKNHALRNKETRDYYKQLFVSNGVSSERLDLRHTVKDINEHLMMYGEVDIALDTFPYNGTTTSCEALWMGVPVITLTGQTHVSRVGFSLLNQIGLEDLVAYDSDAYVEKAIKLAGNVSRLVDLRKTLRQTFLESPLCDAASLARNVEHAYRDMWHKWCTDKLSEK